MGQMFEALLCSGACAAGVPYVDGTAFVNNTATLKKTAEERLKAAGYSPLGTQRMYSGVTGRPLRAAVFIGPISYYALIHKASDKIHARTTGPCDRVTKQPTQGRSSNGGFRMGDMEGAAVMAHGSSRVFCERLYGASDGKCGVAHNPSEATAGHIYVCSTCGLRSDTARFPGGYCNNCDSAKGVVSCDSVAVLDTLISELSTLGIGMKMEVEPKKM